MTTIDAQVRAARRWSEIEKLRSVWRGGREGVKTAVWLVGT